MTTPFCLQNLKFKRTPERLIFPWSTDQIQREISKYHNLLPKGKANLYDIQKLIKKYPEVPVFKNFLCLAYQVKENKKEERAAELAMIEAHPNYFFSKIVQLKHCLENKDFTAIEEMIGSEKDLHTFFPGREIYHDSEVLTFYMLMVKYCYEKKNFMEATRYFNIMEKIDKFHQTTKFCRDIIRDYDWEMDNENEQLEDAPEFELPEQTTEMPEFFHPEIKKLYNLGVDGAEKIVSELLTLPRATLIKDLEKVVMDCVYRFEYFLDLNKNDNLSFNEVNFSTHAYIMLGELNSDDSIEVLLAPLKYDKVVDFWYGDTMSDGLWQSLYKCGRTKINVLKEFILESRHYTYSRWNAISALGAIFEKYPETRQEVKDIFEFLCRHYLAQKDKMYESDHIIVSAMVGELIDINLIEFLPLIKELYENNLVLLDMEGSYYCVVDDFHFNDRYKQKLYNLHGAYERLKFFSESDDEDENDEDEYDDEDVFVDEEPRSFKSMFPPTYEPTMPVKAELKIGRNEKCPCGSGKKYKNCCLTK